MKLIIDIPDEDYKFIKDLQSLIIGGRGNCKSIQKNVINAIRNGTPYEEQPHGKWIEVPVKRDILHPNGIEYVCSACKRDNCYGKPPFCMWCGATMKSEEGLI